MMSLFSSFHVLCADSFGANLRFSGPVVRQSSVPAPEVALKNAGEEIAKKSSDPAPAQEKSSGKVAKQAMKRNPRFAVELDGVHCFETILPF